MKYTKEQMIWILLRLSMGWIFLWAFLDKLFGLGFATKASMSWLNGGSPTTYFLTKGSSGPFSFLFHPLAGIGLVDWLFMLGLLMVGAFLIKGIAVRIASMIGIIMMFLIWLYLFPSTQNPFLDDHIIYILIFIGFIVVDAGQWFSLRNILGIKKTFLK